ncbi:LAMI_0D03092g1_1 [Lachancea mirantina]|uniref:Signal recognition particle receptor subunit beta n=1 Tax=Lachancea mirantina TaxID=1230905 RepID=A0A1G4J9I7_9SACH|nr:LAMI_0D03092g1_1 [Lachancea mirantina]
MNETITISLLILIITTSLLLIIQRQSGNLIPGLPGQKIKNRNPTFIIAGPCGSGKTALFSLLTTDTVKPTVMSQEVNVAYDYMLPSTVKHLKFNLMEFPGHVKLRYRLFEALKESSTIKGLVFVVDSTVDPQKLTDTAEFLHDILAITERVPNGVDVLIACNKSELFTARPARKIREVLEREIAKVIERRAKSLSSVQKGEAGAETDDTNDGFNSHGPLLEYNSTKGFKFEFLEGNVDAVSGSVQKQNIDKWECWVDERAIN